MGSFGREEVPFRGLNEADMALLQRETTLLEQLKVPQLYDANNPNSRLFFVLADGTENDLSDPAKYTNVAKLQVELRNIYKENPHIGFHYKEGVGTQENYVVAKADAVLAFSFKERADELYEKLSEQATTWRQENPHAEISVVHVGFSRGCGVSAYLNRMIDEKGILDTDSKIHISDDKWEYSGKTLIEPGATKQAMVLYDPVLTNMERDIIDPRSNQFSLSNSTVSVLQINANDERRTLFPVSYFINEGVSTDRHSINITLPGSHSDIGGSYKIDGLAQVTRDIQNNYLNALTGKKYFKEIDIPTDIKAYAIHDSSKHLRIYKTVDPRGIHDIINHGLDNTPNSLSVNKMVMESLKRGLNALHHALTPDSHNMHGLQESSLSERIKAFCKQRDLNPKQQETSVVLER